jgi:hypothetical protein
MSIFDGSILTEGRHVVTSTVADLTSWVIKREGANLASTVSWNVTVVLSVTAVPGIKSYTCTAAGRFLAVQEPSLATYAVVCKAGPTATCEAIELSTHR